MSLNVVGKNIIRVDAESKVTGKALFPEDVYMENMVYGKTLRSKVPHAYIKVDTSKAERIDGVLKIFTYKDVPNNEHGVVFKDHEVFCSEKVRRIGDPIAFVVAKDQKICDLALKNIIVEYEEIKGVFDPIEAMKEDCPKVHGDSNILYHFKIRKGNVEEGFKNSHVIVENTYKTHMVDHAFLQPEAGVSFIDEEGRITVIVATQYPHYDKEEIASALKIPEDTVRVINANVGGAFGGREDISLQIHLALAAKELKRPVKTVYSRPESFISHSKRHAMVMKYKTGADKEGNLLALEAEIIGDSGAYASWAMNVLRKSGVHATGPYVIPNVKVDSIAVYTNNPFTGAMRGFGATQVPIAYEQQMDILAEKLGVDPITIRLKNMFKKGSVTATGQVLKESVPLQECLERVIERMDFPIKREEAY
ncbi:xanthine dehydrogenase family protein molybdopterin-binding subunit [Tepidimicrobium xylanilyticum]|uniref:Purine hydroxylase alpha subunit apoprotein n=1 Tax=Tepidimicrobium xylanilyticum TaxID=1123352 RepID=A0A1H2RK37_9FIRM|nr:molybdopterin cofactor-binding domain-containing protein [Tepidimicrobium xylanilyticum]GMG95411.1 aldehyde oxidase [Tepidimicrobium xylanilyticum]SDW19124.1 purine hydroxylase alpha subunit apoprotein [Tepidimicrobium xylanilyticum]